MCAFSLSISCGNYNCDVQDDYRIILFEGSNSSAPLKSRLINGPNRPSDRFLRLHFRQCLAVSVCRGDVMEDYKDQEIENFIEELGVYDGETDTSDPRWSTPLGSHVHAYLIRQKMAEGSVTHPYFRLRHTEGRTTSEPKQLPHDTRELTP